MEGTLLQSLFVRFGLDSSAFSSGMTSIESQGESLVSKASGWGTKLATGLGLTALGGMILNSAKTFEDAGFQIERTTGATGAALAGLEDSMKTLYGESAASADSISAALSQITVKTGETGTALESLTKTSLQFAKVTGSDVKASVEINQNLFAQWGVTTTNQAGKMDELLVATQKSGKGYMEFGGTLLAVSPLLLGMGYSFEDAAALIASFGKHGQDAGAVIGSLNMAMRAWGKAGEDPKVMLADLISRMTAAKTSTESLSIAVASHIRGAAALNIAVRSGVFAFQDIKTAMDNSGGSVAKTAADTQGLGEKWGIFTHQLNLALEPLGTPLLSALSGAVDAMKPLMVALGDLTKGFSSLPGWIQGATVGLIGLAIAGPAVISVIGGITTAIGSMNIISGISSLFAAIPALAVTSVVALRSVATGMTESATAAGVASANFGIMQTALVGLQWGVSIAAAAFAGWKLGEWLYNNVPAMQKFGDAVGGLIIKIPGVQALTDWMAGVGSSTKDLAASAEVLRAKLAAQNIIVVQGTMSLQDYVKALRAAVMSGTSNGALGGGGVPPPPAGGVPTIPVTTIQDTFKPITNDVSNDAKVLADVEANIRSGMDSTSESIAKSGLTIQDYFTKQVDDATRSMNSLADAIPPMATVEEAAGDPTDKLRGFMADLDKQIQATQQTAMDTTAWGAMQTAMHDLGLKSSIDLANLAASSAADYQVILNSGVATAEDVEKAWVKSATDRANADLASGKITQGQYDQIIKNLGTVKTTTDQTASYLAKQLTSISKSVGSAFADLIVDGGKFGDAMMKVLKQITKTIIEDVVQYAFGSLLKAIGGALSASSALGTALKNIGADMTKVFGGSGGAASTATGAAGSAASVGGGTASGATGAVAGGLTGILTSVFTGISAITGIIGLSETAHSNTLLTRIEGNTRGLLNVVYLNGAGTLVDCAIRSFQMLGSIHDILAGGIGINSTVVAVGGGGPSYNFDLRYSVFNGVANVDDLVKQLRARTGLR